MARIGKARVRIIKINPLTIMFNLGQEITRSQIILSAGGVEWAEVKLEPPHWSEAALTLAIV